jgi:hypothetical protein
MARRRTKNGKKRYRKAKKTRRLRGGDYRLYTNETLLGMPIGPSAVYATASGILGLEQWKEMQARKESGQEE